MKLSKRILFLLFSFIICFENCNLGSTFAAEKKAENTDDISGDLEVILNIDTNTMNKYIEGFQQKYPNVKLTYTCYSDYEKNIMDRIKKNDYGDVLFIPASLDAEGVEKYLEPLGDIDTLSQKYNFVDNTYTINGMVYSLPSSAYLKGIVYNEEVFYKAGVTQIPKNQEEFLDDLMMVKERTDAIPFYSCYEFEWILNDWAFFPYIEMTGDTEYRGFKFVYENNPFSEDSNFYRAYKLLYDIVDNNLYEGNRKVTNWWDLCMKINEGQVGCTVAGSWALSQIKAAGENADSIAFMPFPNEIDGKQYATIGIDYGYSISRNSENKEAAEKFIQYMLDESGYAIENDRISIVKTDPLPDVYKKNDNLVMKINKPFTDETYYLYNKLQNGIQTESSTSIRDIIEVATGRKNGNYDELMNDWNMRWEKNRPANMKREEAESAVIKETEEHVEENQDSLHEIILNNYEVELSATEQEYIKEGKHIKVGYLTEMAPLQYEELTESGEPVFKGLASVICKSVEDCTHMKFEYIPYTSSKSMLEDLNNGKLDLLAGMVNDEAYGNDIRFSKEYLELPNVIVKSDTTDVNNLSEKEQAYVAGEERNLEVWNDSNLVAFASWPKLIDSIEKNQVDFAVLNYYSANYYVKEGEHNNVVLIPLTEKAKYGFAFSDDVDTRLISICNKCIYSFPKESIQMTLMQYMDPEPKKVTLKRFIEDNPVGVSIFGMLLLIFILGVFFFIRQEQKRNERKHELDIKRYEILSQLTDEYVFEYNFENDIIHFDEKFVKKFGFAHDIKSVEIENDNEALTSFLSKFDKAKKKDSIDTEPFELLDINNQKQWYRMIAYRIMGDRSKPQHVIGKLMNVQQIVEEQQRIQEEADRDSLTALYNRTGFEKHLADLLTKYPLQTSMALVVLDLDNFKSINDLFGHTGGDEALKTLAVKLHDISSEKILAARYGGDEFMLCMLDATKDEVENICKELVKEMDTYFSFQGNRHKLSISVGGVYTEEILPHTLLFIEADKMLYCVKNEGKNHYRLRDYREEG